MAGATVRAMERKPKEGSQTGPQTIRGVIRISGVDGETFVGGSGPVKSLKSDENGYYEIPYVPDGRFRITASRGKKKATTEVRVDGRAITPVGTKEAEVLRAAAVDSGSVAPAQVEVQLPRGGNIAPSPSSGQMKPDTSDRSMK